MSERKQAIIDKSIELFNENGFYKISLKTIAIALDISPGNVTYHFPKKKDLLENIIAQIIRDGKIEILPKGYVTLFRFQELTQFYYKNQTKYRFFFNNLVYLFQSFPELVGPYRAITEERFVNGKKLMNYYIATGRIKDSISKKMLDSLVQTIITMSIFWNAKNVVFDELSKEDSQMKFMWNLLIPYLSEKGIEEYKEILSQEKYAY